MIRNLFVIGVLLLTVGLNKGYTQKAKPVIRFGLMADTQYADAEPGGSRFYRNSLEKVKECVDSLNSRKVQFTINLGDVIDRDRADLDSVMFYLNGLDHKLYSTTGNHDYKGVTDNRILFERLGMPAEYYFFKKKNWVFVFLNTNEVAPYSNIAGTAKEKELKAMYARIKATGGKQGARWNGGVSARQLEWLEQLLKQSGKAGNQVLIFCHHPLYPQTAFVALNNKEILEVIGRYTCVKAVFCGHHHTGGFGYFRNIPVVTVEGMIETRDQNAFGIVEIYPDKIVVEGKGRMTSRTLEWNNSF